jgi:hypothetical protein
MLLESSQLIVASIKDYLNKLLRQSLVTDATPILAQQQQSMPVPVAPRDSQVPSVYVIYHPIRFRS